MNESAVAVVVTALFHCTTYHDGYYVFDGYGFDFLLYGSRLVVRVVQNYFFERIVYYYYLVHLFLSFVIPPVFLD